MHGTLIRIAIRASMAMLLLALIGGGVAHADVSLGESGLRGTHRLKEPPNGPASGFGAWCVYNEAAHRLSHVWIVPPVVFAYNGHAGSGNDLQWVGWAARVQRWTGSAWVTHFTSTIRRKQANDNARAHFGNASTVFDYVVTEPGLRLRAVVQMFWFTRTSSTEKTGSSTHLVQTYAKTFEGSDVSEIETTNCAPTRA